jgi:flavorubredoxin
MTDTTALAGITLDLSRPTPLHAAADHAVYWLGIVEETAFRCNVYLIQDGDMLILVDPGSRAYFEQVRARVAQVADPARVSGMILCHQDPDVAASMTDWLAVNPDMAVYTTPRTQVLLPHYGISDYRYADVEAEPELTLPSGATLRFIPAPFLHFPGAFTTYDSASRILFSGDIWAALDSDWRLLVEDFETHTTSMDLFHMDYMASNVAARGFVQRLEGLAIDAIAPQHGSVIGPEHVPAALDYLAGLECGLDLIYPDLT